MANVKKKLVSGVFWESIGQFSSLGIQFVVTIIIARILTPADYGVIGLLSVFTALSLIILDSGFSVALIQNKNANQTDYSSVFFFNLVVSLLLYGIFFFASPYIAAFYDIPELTKYVKILFLIIPITSFGLVQNVILQKQLLFKKSAVASVGASLLSGIIGIVMAYLGYGIMTLVCQQIAMYFFRTLLYVAQIQWIPTLNISLAPIKKMFSFSVHLMLHSIVNTTMKNIYTLVIGKSYSSEAVGYYNQAARFENVSASTITSVIMKVSFPALVSVQDDVKRIKEAYKRILSMTTFIVSPIMILLIIIAKPLFNLLLTEKWLPGAFYFQILCLYGLTLPVIQISYNIYKLYKKGRMLVIIDTCRHLLIITAIVVTIKLGVPAMLFGQFIAMFIMFFVNMYYSGKLISYSIKEQIQTLSPYYILAFLSGIIVYFIPTLNCGNFVNILLLSFFFLTIYLFLAAIFKISALKETSTIAKQLINKFKK
jgi:O-antigen/teichoic acid export membrane protein